MHEVWRFWHWSLSALARGIYPRRRFDGDWRAGSDDARARRGGEAMVVRGAVVMTKGDLMEFSVSFGFPAMGSGGRPCTACCWHPGIPMGDFLAMLNPRHFPFPLTTHEQYIAAISKFEIPVEVTLEHHRVLSPLLQYDKRTTTSSSNGLALVEDYAPLNLRRGDRLEPSENLSDIGKFDDIMVFPVLLTFWRCSRETLAKHRCPLFDAAIGLTLDSFFFDILHTLFLGVLNVVAREFLWTLIEKDAWRTRARGEVRLKVSVAQLRTQIFHFYGDYSRSHGGRTLTEISDLTPKMLGGSYRHRALRLKGMECWGVFLYLPHLLAEFRGTLGVEFHVWRDAIFGLIDHVEILREHRESMPAAAIQKLFDTYAKVMTALASLPSFSFTPIFHIWMHIVYSTVSRGSAWVAACFLDEGYNHTLKKAAKGVHAAVFERRVLRRMEFLMQLVGKRLRGTPSE